MPFPKELCFAVTIIWGSFCGFFGVLETFCNVKHMGPEYWERFVPVVDRSPKETGLVGCLVLDKHRDRIKLYSLWRSWCVVFLALGLCFFVFLFFACFLGSHCWWHVHEPLHHSPAYLDNSPSHSHLGATKKKRHTPAFTLSCILSFRQHKLCRLLWTLRRLKSFKISPDYRLGKDRKTF